MKYSEAIPIKTRPRTVWLVKYADGRQQVQIWHADAKVEDVVEAINNQNVFTKPEFSVAAVDVGIFDVAQIQTMMSDGRGVNQSMETVIQ